MIKISIAIEQYDDSGEVLLHRSQVEDVNHYDTWMSLIPVFNDALLSAGFRPRHGQTEFVEELRSKEDLEAEQKEFKEKLRTKVLVEILNKALDNIQDEWDSV